MGSAHDLNNVAGTHDGQYAVHAQRGLIDASALWDPAEQERVVADTTAWYGLADGAALGDALDRLLGEEAWPAHFEGTYPQLAAVKDLSSDLIGRFVSSVCEATIAAHGPGPLRRYAGDVVVPERTRAEIALLKGLAVTYVMLPRESEPRYYEQRTVLFDLVDALVENPRALEPHFFEAWKARDESGRLRVIVDQVASLTDQSARQWHSRLCGFLRN